MSLSTLRTDRGAPIRRGWVAPLILAGVLSACGGSSAEECRPPVEAPTPDTLFAVTIRGGSMLVSDTAGPEMLAVAYDTLAQEMTIGVNVTRDGQIHILWLWFQYRGPGTYTLGSFTADRVAFAEYGCVSETGYGQIEGFYSAGRSTDSIEIVSFDPDTRLLVGRFGFVGRVVQPEYNPGDDALPLTDGVFRVTAEYGALYTNPAARP